MNAALLVHGGGGWKKSTLPGGDTTLVVEVGDVGVPSFSFSALALDPFVAFGLALFRGLFAPAAELDIFFKIKAVFFNTRKTSCTIFSFLCLAHASCCSGWCWASVRCCCRRGMNTFWSSLSIMLCLCSLTLDIVLLVHSAWSFSPGFSVLLLCLFFLHHTSGAVVACIYSQDIQTLIIHMWFRLGCLPPSLRIHTFRSLLKSFKRETLICIKCCAANIVPVS